MWFEQSCPDGYRVVSGGVEASGIVAILASYPVSDVRWKLGIESMRGGTTNAKLHIICIGE